jgi:hypothetical protein
MRRPALEDLAVARGADEADRLASAFSASIPASPLVAIAVPAIARQADPRELLLDRVGGARRIGDEDDAAPLARHCRSRSAAPG